MRGLQGYISDDQRDWNTVLPAIVFAINTSVSRSNALNDSSFYLTFARDGRVPILSQMGVDSPVDVNDPVGDLQTYKEHLATKMLTAMNETYTIHEKMKCTYKQQHERKYANKVDIHRGDRVYITRPNISKRKSRSLSTQYVGPFRVMDKNDIMAKLTPFSNPFVKEEWVPLRRLKLANNNYVPSYKDEIATREFLLETEDESLDSDEPNFDIDPVESSIVESLDHSLEEDTQFDGETVANNFPIYQQRKELILDAMTENQQNREREAGRGEESDERKNSRYNLRRKPSKKKWDDYLVDID